jgi:hypothetical protein
MGVNATVADGRVQGAGNEYFNEKCTFSQKCLKF